MIKFIATLLIIFTCTFFSIAQTTQPTTSQPATTQPANKTHTMTNETPYRSIGDYPKDYSNAAVVQRSIDGLGYRLYWATEGLRAEDLAYSPGNEGKTAEETLKHMYNLSLTIHNGVKGIDNVRPSPEITMDFAQLRHATLQNLKDASDYLRNNSDLDFENVKLTFVRGEKRSTSPFWHLVNGPILDAVYHTGQIVSYRRTSGNPTHPKVNVFSGKAPE